ncbi:MAG: biotin synthase auxiliary protein BsaP [Mycobacteriales bacterium]
MVAGAFCDRCGRAIREGGHERCANARALEPPRFCPVCGRRMKVQVTPLHWTALCVEHGLTEGSDAPGPQR